MLPSPRGSPPHQRTQTSSHPQTPPPTPPIQSLTWYSWMQYEWRHQAYPQLEALFSEALRPRGDVRMWRLYLEYVRAGHTTQDAVPPESGGGGGDTADASLLQRKTMQKAYELALSHVGLDLDALSIYRDYIDFVQAWRVGRRRMTGVTNATHLPFLDKLAVRAAGANGRPPQGLSSGAGHAAGGH